MGTFTSLIIFYFLMWVIGIYGGVFVLLVFFKLQIYVIHTLLYVYKLSHNLKIKAFVSEVTLAIVRKLSYQSWPGP